MCSKADFLRLEEKDHVIAMSIFSNDSASKINFSPKFSNVLQNCEKIIKHLDNHQFAKLQNYEIVFELFHSLLLKKKKRKSKKPRDVIKIDIYLAREK